MAIFAIGGAAAGGILGLGAGVLVAGVAERPQPEYSPAEVSEAYEEHLSAQDEFEIISANGEKIRLMIGESCINLIESNPGSSDDGTLVEVLDTEDDACGAKASDVAHNISSWNETQTDVRNSEERLKEAESLVDQVSNPDATREADATGYLLAGALAGAAVVGLAGVCVEREVSYH